MLTVNITGSNSVQSAKYKYPIDRWQNTQQNVEEKVKSEGCGNRNFVFVYGLPEKKGKNHENRKCE